VNPAIESRNLFFAYKDRGVLHGISMSVAQGEMLGILGPNGSGKTTLLNVLSGILHGRGEVKINGQSIQRIGRRELSKLFAVVPQESKVNFPYTVAEIVMMGRACYHSEFALESKEDLDVARASMELTDSLLLSDRYLH
jgi:iron complex transport system ATP-binding protein